MSVITLPTSFVVFLILFSIYGLFVSAVVFAVAAVSLVQRKTMHSEVKRYTALLELANANMESLLDVKTGHSNGGQNVLWTATLVE